MEKWEERSSQEKRVPEGPEKQVPAGRRIRGWVWSLRSLGGGSFVSSRGTTFNIRHSVWFAFFQTGIAETLYVCVYTTLVSSSEFYLFLFT